MILFDHPGKIEAVGLFEPLLTRLVSRELRFNRLKPNHREDFSRRTTNAFLNTRRVGNDGVGVPGFDSYLDFGT